MLHAPHMNEIAVATTADDIAYVRAAYVTKAELARHRAIDDAWIGTLLPRATYRLADGSEWFTRDWWRLADDAGDPQRIPALFARRHEATAAALGVVRDVAEDWDGYVSGE